MNQSKDKKDFLKVGIIGCGKMSRNHVLAISHSRNARVVAAADPGIASTDLPAWFDAGVDFFNSTEEMLASASPDVVHVVTPPATHYSLARMALEKGCHVYMEKPFTTNLKEAQELVLMAEERGLEICAGHQLLFTRAVKNLNRMLDQVEKVVHVESYFSFRTVRRGITPVDQLADILPHPVYLLQDVMARAEVGVKGDFKVVYSEGTSEGEARAVITRGKTKGVLIVTLSGRPVDSYIKVTGTNGSLFVDLVRGVVIKNPGPGASIFSALLSPFSAAFQVMFKTTGAIARLFSDRKKGYPGLSDLLESFYLSIMEDSPPPMSTSSILFTVGVCEEIGNKARKSEEAFEKKAARELEKREKELSPPEKGFGKILLTGGTGLFGRPTAARLRQKGWPVTVLSRNIPPYSKREPGVEYVATNLADELPPGLLEGVETVIHAAAETAGGKSEHEKNSIRATEQLLKASEAAGVSRFIHISSIAVLKSSGKPGADAGLKESSEADYGNLSRGPYVWGKAESEKLAVEFAANSTVDVKVVRLGPLVDYENFKPPGRLGREIHNLFVAMGTPGNPLSVCSVGTAARVMTAYVDDFSTKPPMLNLVEPETPTRGELLRRWKSVRYPLRTLWVPFFVIGVLSPILVGLQKVLLRGQKPISIISAFSSEKYDTTLVAGIMDKLEE